MAGAGKKTFVQGNQLNASELNTYLMDQSVMVFASASAREIALPVGTRSEGMFAYTKDTKTFWVFDGSSWVALGIATNIPLNAWTGYTPTLTSVTAGNGTYAFTYIQIGKTVHVRGRFTLGSTSAVTGSISISLPVNATGVFVGSATMRAGGADYPAFVGNSSTAVTLGAVGAAGTYANRVTTSATVPGTWTTGDFFSISLTYEAA